MKKNIYLSIAFGIVLLTIFSVVFIWPGFYTQYRMMKGVVITDVSSDEIGVIRENLYFDLPKNIKITSANYNFRLQESVFSIIFSIPEEDKETFINSLPEQFVDSESNSEEFIEISNQNLTPHIEYNYIGKEFTALLEYQAVDGRFWFKWYCSEPADAIHEMFEQRIKVF